MRSESQFKDLNSVCAYLGALDIHTCSIRSRVHDDDQSRERHEEYGQTLPKHTPVLWALSFLKVHFKAWISCHVGCDRCYVLK